MRGFRVALGLVYLDCFKVGLEWFSVCAGWIRADLVLVWFRVGLGLA